MIEPSHVDFAFDSLGRPTELRDFFEFAGHYAASPPASDLVLRVQSATDALSQSQASIDLPGIEFVVASDSHSVVDDLAAALRQAGVDNVTTTPVSRFGADRTIQCSQNQQCRRQFQWNALAAVRIRQLMMRWLSRRDHRIVISTTSKSLVETQLLIAIASLAPKRLNDSNGTDTACRVLIVGEELVPPPSRNTLSLYCQDKDGTTTSLCLSRWQIDQLSNAGFEIPGRPQAPCHSRAIELSHTGGRPVTRVPKSRPKQRARKVSQLKSARTTFSASQLETYVQCPAKYFYRYEIGLSPSQDEYVRIPLVFGQAIHRVLERAFSRPGTSGEAINPVELVDDVLNTLVLTPPLTAGELKIIRAQLQRACSGIATAESCLRSVLGQATEPLYFEWPFEFEHNGVTLCGRVDRIDRLADRSLLLIDYKTGSVSFSPDQIKSGKHFQAPIYLLAARALLGAPIAGFVFYDLRDFEITRGLVSQAAIAQTADKKLVRGHSVDNEKLEEILHVAEQHIARVVAEIRSGAFEPKPSVQACNNCRFAMLCRRSAQLTMP